jgi:hypothetical protein
MDVAKCGTVSDDAGKPSDARFPLGGIDSDLAS